MKTNDHYTIGLTKANNPQPGKIEKMGHWGIRQTESSGETRTIRFVFASTKCLPLGILISSRTWRIAVLRRLGPAIALLGLLSLSSNAQEQKPLAAITPAEADADFALQGEYLGEVQRENG